MTERPTPDSHRRFMRMFAVNQQTGCWEWTGFINSRGYGQFHMRYFSGKKNTRAHRSSWEIHNGPIPNGLWVLHKCDNRKCANPDHLFLGNQRDNMLDAARKGRICTIGWSRHTHCKNGHEYTPENTRRRSEGYRQCLTCLARHKVAKNARARHLRSIARALLGEAT